jgi:hypothetical protein
MPTVIKANGQPEDFSEKKLIDSIRRAGIPANLEEEVLEHIKSNLYENIPTHEIYYHLEEYLGHTKSPYYKNKYSLKRALMDLGPTGFPFEAYVAEILKAQGYETQVGEILMGKCVSHEVDIIAKNKTQKIMVECKFHNRPGWQHPASPCRCPCRDRPGPNPRSPAPGETVPPGRGPRRSCRWPWGPGAGWREEAA